MFPGAEAKKTLDVITAAITVAILLLLNALDWIITKGRRYPGSDPEGAGNSAHHISPRFITIFLAQLNAIARKRLRCPGWNYHLGKPCSVHR